MLAYSLVGTNDRDTSTAFYDPLLAELGAARAMEIDRITLYAAPDGGPFLGLAEPFDGQPARPGNGTMVSLAAPDHAAVDRVHARALALGATDEGAPGPRHNAGLDFYAGYFRDPDGNKLNVFCMAPA